MQTTVIFLGGDYDSQQHNYTSLWPNQIAILACASRKQEKPEPGWVMSLTKNNVLGGIKSPFPHETGILNKRNPNTTHV
jgi:hypothetical protein